MSCSTLEIHDPEAYAAYRLDGQASIRRFGGRVLSGDPAPEGVVELLEREWDTRRLVITEFPTIDIARAWYHPDLYQAAARKRQASSSGRVLARRRLGPALVTGRMARRWPVDSCVRIQIYL